MSADGIRTADVVVVGAGTVGAMALWHLSRETGTRVVGIEQYGRAHGRGSFAGESRLFRVAYKEGDVYVPLLREARRLWHELQDEAARSLFLPVGALSIGAPDQPEMQATLATIASHDLPHRVLDQHDLREAFPPHAPREGDIGILDTQGGGLRPEASVLGALDLAERAGVDMLYHCPVLDIEVQRGGVVVRTAQGAISAGVVVIAAGSWASELVPALAELVSVRQLALTWFMPRDIGAYEPERFPVFMRDIGTAHVFGAPSLDGYSVKVSPGHDGMAQGRRVSDLPTTLSSRQLRLLGLRIREFFPDMNPEPVRFSSHHDAYTEDRVPIIDRSADGRVVMVTGLSGHGFKFAPVFGRLVRDLVVDGRSADLPPSFSLAEHLTRRAG